jgi:hypothetical protein
MKKTIITILFVALLIGGGVALGLNLTKQKEEPTSTVELSLNPDVMFVLNKDGRVLSTNNLNTDADVIFSNIKVDGRKIEEVACEFTEKAIKSGYNITYSNDVEDEQNVITITITTGSSEQAENLKNALVSKINETFDKYGVFGRAVADIEVQTTNLEEKYAKILENLQLTAEDISGKTETEVLEIIKEQSQKLKDLCHADLEKLNEFLNSDEVLGLRDKISTYKTEVQDILSQIADLIPDGAKETYKQQYEQVEKLIASTTEEIETLVNSKIAELKQNSTETLSNFKQTYQQMVEKAKEEFEKYEQEFNENKDEILAQIKVWRESFEQ